MARIAVVGAGPAGSLAAGMLADLGHEVVLLDRRNDPTEPARDGRATPLALHVRGRRAIAAAGDELLSAGVGGTSVVLARRIVHGPDGSTVISETPEDRRGRSIARHDLSAALFRWARTRPRVEVRLGTTCLNVSRSRRQVELRGPEGHQAEESFDAVIGADGAASEVRWAVARMPSVDIAKVTSPWGYAEVIIGADEGRHRLDGDAVHVWPGRSIFLFALPQVDGTFTCTLYARHADWPVSGYQVIHGLPSGEPIDLDRLGDRYPEAWPHLVGPSLENIRNGLKTVQAVRVDALDDGGWIALIGDAGHAMTPYLGQGVNLALEDAVELARRIGPPGGDLPAAIRAYGKDRHPEGIGAADLSDLGVRLYTQMPFSGPDPLAMTVGALNMGELRHSDAARMWIPGWRPVVQPERG